MVGMGQLLAREIKFFHTAQPCLIFAAARHRPRGQASYGWRTSYTLEFPVGQYLASNYYKKKKNNNKNISNFIVNKTKTLNWEGNPPKSFFPEIFVVVRLLLHCLAIVGSGLRPTY